MFTLMYDGHMGLEIGADAVLQLSAGVTALSCLLVSPLSLRVPRLVSARAASVL